VVQMLGSTDSMQMGQGVQLQALQQAQLAMYATGLQLQAPAQLPGLSSGTPPLSMPSLSVPPQPQPVCSGQGGMQGPDGFGLTLRAVVPALGPSGPLYM
jgi:hypothetical protein